MGIFTLLLGLSESTKFAPVLLALSAGLGALATKNYSGAASDILTGITAVFSAATVVGLHGSVAANHDAVTSLHEEVSAGGRTGWSPKS